MYHADLVGSILGLLFRKRVVWGVRQSNLGAQLNKRSTLFIARICSRISKYLPRSIIYNSEAARTSHESIGYFRSKAEVVHNGIDCQKFTEEPGARKFIRTELRIPQDALVVGHIEVRIHRKITRLCWEQCPSLGQHCRMFTLFLRARELLGLT